MKRHSAYNSRNQYVVFRPRKNLTSSTHIEQSLLNIKISYDKYNNFDGIYFTFGTVGILQMEYQKQIKNSMPKKLLELDFKQSLCYLVGDYITYLYAINKRNMNCAYEISFKEFIEYTNYTSTIGNSKEKGKMIKRFLNQFNEAIKIFQDDKKRNVQNIQKK